MPAGTPRPMVETLNQEMRRGSGAALLALVQADIPRFRKLVQDIGIQPE